MTESKILEKNNDNIKKTIGYNSEKKTISELDKQEKKFIAPQKSEQSIVLYEKQVKDYLTDNIENIIMFMTFTLDYPYPQPMLD